jgi:hypothetical protein
VCLRGTARPPFPLPFPPPRRTGSAFDIVIVGVVVGAGEKGEVERIEKLLSGGVTV